MNCRMDRDEMMSFRKGLKGVTIRCESGRIWLTVAGEGVDHILLAGEETIVRSKGKAVVVADDQSSVLLYRSIAQTIPTGFVRHSRLVRAVPLRAGQLPNSLWV
jgi:hypothetical protein